MARIATQRTQRLRLGAVLLPLWASYLAKVYAWISILEKGGALNLTFSKLRLPDPNLVFTNGAMWIAFSYIWRPYMIVPICGARERIASSLLDASAVLARSLWSTLRRVIVPLALPVLLAGSFFTFSLTLGDYVTPPLISGAKSTIIGNAIYENLLTHGNISLVAALSAVPLQLSCSISPWQNGSAPSRHYEARTTGARWPVDVGGWVGGVVFFGFVMTNIETWPIQHWTLHWYSGVWNAPQVCSAFVLSLKVAFATTVSAARVNGRFRRA